MDPEKKKAVMDAVDAELIEQQNFIREAKDWIETILSDQKSKA